MQEATVAAKPDIRKTAENAKPAAAPLALDAFLPYRLSVLANSVSRAIARLYAERFDLTIPEWRVMAVLGSCAPLSANQVAERTAMDKVRVSRAVARLMRSGRLDRSPDAADRRRSLLRLSKHGNDIYREIVPLARAVERKLVTALDAGEQRTLDDMMRKLQARAQDLP